MNILDIKRRIPTHCFQSNVIISLWYALRSFSFVILLGVLLHTNWIPLVFYAYLQGTVFWGIFTIGHDCGHGAFSQYPMLNWIVGNMLHSFILTPYEAWRQSHKSHHSNTCNADKDEIFYPNPPTKHAALVTTLGGAWFFYILFSNVPRRRNYLAYFKTNEFRDSAFQLTISFASLFGALACILQACRLFGCYTVFIFYGAPLFVFASWLVIVTFLHHHDEDCTWYNNKSWTKLKGSLAAVDRDYGWLVNTLSHSIHLHQIHHLFPIIPHYHLAEATRALQEAFPQLYKSRGGSNVVAFTNGVQKWWGFVK